MKREPKSPLESQEGTLFMVSEGKPQGGGQEGHLLQTRALQNRAFSQGFTHHIHKDTQAQAADDLQSWGRAIFPVCISK